MLHAVPLNLFTLFAAFIVYFLREVMPHRVLTVIDLCYCITEACLFLLNLA